MTPNSRQTRTQSWISASRTASPSSPVAIAASAMPCPPIPARGRSCRCREPRSGAQRAGDRVAERKPRVIGVPTDLNDRGGGRCAVQKDARRIRPARHPRQQRHQRLAGQLLPDGRSGLGPRVRSQAARHRALHPPRRAADARAQMGPHRQHLRRRGLDAAARRHHHWHQQRRGAKSHRRAGRTNSARTAFW